MQIQLFRYAIPVFGMFMLGNWHNKVHGQEGGIEVFSAGTIFVGGTRASATYTYKSRGSLFRGSNEISDPQNRQLDEYRIVASVDHGFRPDLTASLLVPYVSRTLDTNGQDSSGSGLGDVAFLIKYRAWKKDWKRSAAHFALIGGMEAPTGTTNERDNGALLPPSLQPGSGSWDPFAGILTNVNLDRFRFAGVLFYKANSEGAQDFEEGDFLAVEIDGGYRFYHKPYPGPSANVKVGFQWRHQERSKQNGVSQANSGSDEIVLRTGLTWHPIPRLDITSSVDLPLYQNFNGEQLARDIRVFFGFGVRF
jgi:hypothetical protein